MVNIWRDLTHDEVREFVEWVLANWKPCTEVNPVWHPVVRSTWGKLDSMFATAKTQILADFDSKEPGEISMNDKEKT